MKKLARRGTWIKTTPSGAAAVDPNAILPAWDREYSLSNWTGSATRSSSAWCHEPSNPSTKPVINDLGEPVQSFFKFGSSMTICARRIWESIRTGCRITLPPSPVEDFETTETVSIQVSPTVKNTCWSAQSQDNLAQTAFLFAIFCAMNITTPCHHHPCGQTGGRT
jgi:hypothetical protein